MTRAFEKAPESVREKLLAAMEMPIEENEQKEAKIAAVKAIYADLNVGEEAKQEIIKMHSQAMGYVKQLDLTPDNSELLNSYANKLIGRTK